MITPHPRFISFSAQSRYWKNRLQSSRRINTDIAPRLISDCWLLWNRLSIANTFRHWNIRTEYEERVISWCQFCRPPITSIAVVYLLFLLFALRLHWWTSEQNQASKDSSMHTSNGLTFSTHVSGNHGNCLLSDSYCLSLLQMHTLSPSKATFPPSQNLPHAVSLSAIVHVSNQYF